MANGLKKIAEDLVKLWELNMRQRAVLKKETEALKRQERINTDQRRFLAEQDKRKEEAWKIVEEQEGRIRALDAHVRVMRRKSNASSKH